MKYLKRLLGVGVLVLLGALPAPAQTLADRIDALEKTNADTARRLAAIDGSLQVVNARLAAIEAKLPGPSGQIVAGPKADGVAPHLPTPPCPNCQCGCTVTGSCTCKDCDHPALTKPQQKTWIPPNGPDQPVAAVHYYTDMSTGIVTGTDGSTHRLGQGLFASYTFVGVPDGGGGISATQGGQGGCANGSCSSGGNGRSGLFGRFRR